LDLNPLQLIATNVADNENNEDGMAAASLFSILIDETIQYASLIWVELILASLAAIFYFTLSGLAGKSGSAKMKPSSGAFRQEQSSDVKFPQRGGSCESSPPTPVQLIMKALRQGKVIEAIDLIQTIPEASESLPEGLAHRLLMAVSKGSRSSETLAKLAVLAGKISSATLDVAMTDAMNGKDVTACRQLHIISDIISIPKSPTTFKHLAKVYFHDVESLRALVQEAEAPLATPFAQLALEACAVNKDSALIKEIFEKASSSDDSFLRSALEKAQAMAKAGRGKYMVSPVISNDGSETETPESDSPRTVGQIEEQPGLKVQSLRDSVVSGKTILHKEVAMRANDIRSCGKNGDLRGAVKVFERVGQLGQNTLLLNSMLEACVECKDVTEALSYFTHARESGLADVVSYNTMMKGYIMSGQEAAAKALLQELSEKGMGATRASFHGLLNARVNAKDLKSAWRLVEEMQASGIMPNAVTCSILLKGKLTSLSDVSRVLALIDVMDQPMDEVLFLSVVDACIRTGRLDLLSRQTEKFLNQSASTSLTAPTFGSMIKAYGHARDVKRVRELWQQMLAHKVQPTAVTLGCMTEALVANGCPSEAWKLAQKTWEDKTSRNLVNTVIYSSILKGFANAKETEQVLALYEEMKDHQIQPNTITFNTILNAFAQGGAMNRVPALLEDMKVAVPPVEPDIVTYSTIVKGFCNSGHLDRAFKVLKDMKASGKYAPDEVMYNSLLSGCAKEHRPDEALQIISDMKKSGVAPSNYTLSMLVKLMGRCKRLNQAFGMLDDIAKEYKLKINIQVYTCLMQGCFNAGSAGKAISLHDKVIKDGLLPDAMTYTVLVRGCIQAGLFEKAVEMAKCAHGLETQYLQSKGSPPGLTAGVLDEVVAALGPKSHDALALLSEVSTSLAARPECRRSGPPLPAARSAGKNAGASVNTRSSAKKIAAEKTGTATQRSRDWTTVRA
jgi:pentatricopeptide repeat protein